MLKVMLEAIQIAIQMQRVILIAEQKITHLILDVVNFKKRYSRLHEYLFLIEY